MITDRKCPICGCDASAQHFADFIGYKITCPRCGEFYISKQLEHTIERNLSEKQVAIISGFLRRNNDFKLTINNFDNILSEARIPSYEEKSVLILNSLWEINNSPGAEIDISEGSKNYYEIFGKSYIENYAEFMMLIEHLEKTKNYIKLIKYATIGINFKYGIIIQSEGIIYLSDSDKLEKITQKLFLKGEIFEPYAFVCNLIKKANRRIILIDNYIDESVLTILSKKKKNVELVVYTRKISDQLRLDVDKFRQQYGNIEMKTYKDSHDRYLIIDDKQGYHFGASIKDLGKSCFTFSNLEDGNTQKLIKSLKE